MRARAMDRRRTARLARSPERETRPVPSWHQMKLAPVAILRHGKVSVPQLSSEFHPLWLRLHDPSRKTRNQQRLFEMSKVIDDRESSKVRSLCNESQVLRIQWADGEESSFDWDWLARHVTPQLPRRLWGSAFQDDLPWMDYAQLATKHGKLKLCTSLERYGLALLTGAGLAAGTIERAGNLIGHVRVTNYGAIFDVKDDGAKATNLAFTNQRISAHTDNPYRDPFPGVQMLHCLSAADEGGATLFTDGFAVARELQRTEPDAG